MQLAKLITPKKIKALYCVRFAFVVLFLTAFSPVFSQDNSPYSRYGIGDLVPQTHIIGRGMGNISAGFTDFLSINFNNPASYSSFQAGVDQKTKKLMSARAILDVGLNFESRTIQEPGVATKFNASNALFSYIQIGMPLKNNWGLSFGLRPISRISYKVIRNEHLIDPLTGDSIEKATTRFEGDGGAYLVSIGTGFSLFRDTSAKGERKLSFGINAGYLFGKKDYSSRRSLINDTVDYYQANYETKSTFGDLYFDAGVQYKMPLSKKVSLTLGAYGNWSQDLNARQDILRETFLFDPDQGNLRLDSVSDIRDIKGQLVYPASYTLGFAVEKLPQVKEGGWMLGIDFFQQNWSKYRFFGQIDSVQNKWELRVGGHIRPTPNPRNYFSNVTYRAGFFTGPDYIKVGNKLSQFGTSVGLGLPFSRSRQAPNQATIINLAFEYSKRGNNTNLLKENMFRFSLGFSLSDFWFIRRKYD